MLEDVPRGPAGLAIASVVAELDYDDAKILSKLFSIIGIPSDGAIVLATAIDNNPDSVDFDDQMLLGEVWMLARELNLAIGSFQLALDMKASGELSLRIAQLYFQWEKFEAARNALQVAVQNCGEEAPGNVYYLLAIIEINLGNFVAASNAIARIEDDETYAERARRLYQFIDISAQN